MQNLAKRMSGAAAGIAVARVFVVSLLLAGVALATLDRTTAWAAQFVSLRAPKTVLSAVDKGDTAALRAQALALAAKAATREDFVRAWLQSEEDLDAARRRAWEATPFTSALAVVIDEPVALAVIDLAIGVRRTVGPRLHTEVDGLEASAGCAGDFVADRLLVAYGTAALRRARGEKAGGLEIEVALHRIAVQIACMSDRQLAELEAAMRTSFEQTAARMKEAGLQALIPAFARLLAPVQVLIFDARKHRGIWSRSWHWFSDYGELLEEDVARAGWASDKVFLWDRRRGKLLGFPSCAKRSGDARCLDLAVFLRSLRDPRAIGTGYCALASMVATAPSKLGADSRYACPTSICEGSTAGGPATPSDSRGSSGVTAVSSSNASDPNGLAWRWPRLSEGDRSAMAILCRAAGAVAPGPGGPRDASQQCEIAKPSNPFDTFNACIVAGTGAGAGNRSIGSLAGEQFAGVPTGKKCNPLADGTGASAAPYDRCPGQSCADKHDPCPGASCEGKGKAGGSSGAGGTGTGTDQGGKDAKGSSSGTDTSSTGAGTTSPAPGTGATPSPSSREAELERIIAAGKEHPENHAAVQRAREAQAELDRRQALRELLRSLDTNATGPQRSHDCADPGGCADTCTGLGRQLAAAKACANDLLGAVTEAAGMPGRKKVPPKRDRGPVELVSQDAPVPVSNQDICLLGPGAAAPAKPNLACGLMLCSSGFLGSIERDGCQCDKRAISWQSITKACVYKTDCTEGSAVDETCTCQPIGESKKTPTAPSPRPTPEWVGKRTEFTPAVINIEPKGGLPFGQGELDIRTPVPGARPNIPKE